MDTFTAWTTVAVVFAVIGMLIMTHMPKHWQTPGGYVLVTLGGIPAALLAITIFSHPAILIPAVFAFGVLCATRRP